MTATLFHTAEIIFPVFALVALGLGYGKIVRVGLDSLNRINLDIFLPSLIFLSLAQSRGDAAELLWIALGGAGIMLGSGIVAWPISRALGAPTAVFVPPMMFTNYGNIGLPLIALAFGRDALPIAVALFIVGNALHLTVGFKMLSGQIRAREILSTPMLLATALGFAVRFADFSLPPLLETPLRMAADAAIPLMLFALGARMAKADIGDFRIAAWGALICPLTGLICWLAIAPFLPIDGEARKILALFAILPPAVLNYIFAERFGVAPRMVASIVLIGNMFAFITLPIAVALLL